MKKLYETPDFELIKFTVLDSLTESIEVTIAESELDGPQGPEGPRQPKNP